MSTESSSRTAPRLSPNHQRVVVGFDGSAGSDAAVEWAAREAEQRRSALRIVTCWAVPPDVDFYGIGSRQQHGLQALVEDTRRNHPRLVIGSSATHLDPRDALIDEAESADLLVIGSSEAGVAKQMLLGSVTRTAARRSACPVVVVNGAGGRRVDTIVIGVDGSKAAATALDWACAEAELHGASLTIVHAREASMSIDAARRVVEDAVEECHARTMCSVSAELTVGDAAAALIRASEDADLVVIGSRGRSGFKTAVFGSVALTVADAAACPVAITHPRMRRD